MRYIVDNDLHIHTYLSPCSQDIAQTPDNILKYALNNSFKNICITDHYWDPKVPGASPFLAKLDTALLKKALPLPKAEGVRFMFGCETELDKHGNLAIHRDTCDEFDFIVIPINHFHMEGFTLPEVSRITAYTPASAVGLENTGKLEKGFDADIIVADDLFNIKKVFTARQ